MKSDIEIARSATLQPIDAIARRLEIPGSAVQHYGRSIGKIDFDFLQTQYDKRDGQLILVTAISPTPAGEGKTTTTVGLGDALNRNRQTYDCLSARAIARSMFWHEGWRPPAAGMRRSCLWIRSTYISRATFTQSPQLIISSRLCWITIFIGAIAWE